MTDYQLYRYTPTFAGGIIFGLAFLALLIGFFSIIFQSFSKVKMFSNRSVHSYYIGGKAGNCLQGSAPVYEEAALHYQKSTVSDFKRQVLPMFIPLMVGVIMEAVGYFARAHSSKNGKLLSPYIIQSVLLLIAPSFIAATIYMIFGRMMRLLNASDFSIIKFKHQTTFFVVGDVVSFLVQASGGGMMMMKNSRRMATNIVIAGLIIQLFFFGFFIVSEVKFTHMINKYSSSPCYERNRQYIFGRIPVDYRTLNFTLMGTSALIVIRCIVRVIEFAQGFDGFIISHEVFLYLLDGFLMMIACFAILCVRPESILFGLMLRQ